MENKTNLKLAGIFFSGVAAGIAGYKLAKTETAKKMLVKTTAAALRAKDAVLEGGTEVQAAAEDLIAEAKEVNKQKEEAAVEEVK